MTEYELITQKPVSIDLLQLDESTPHDERLSQLPESVHKALDQIATTPLAQYFSEIIYFSDFFYRTIQRYPQGIVELIQSEDLINTYESNHLINKVEQSIGKLNDIDKLDAFLRQLRHIEMARIVWRELSGVADTERTIEDLSNLADACLQLAVAVHSERLWQKYGKPFDEQSDQTAEFVVFALGKLGGKELNFSSDIDLVFAFSANGNTLGEKSISNNEFFIKLGQAVINSLNEINDQGQVYRVDMRLRPNGQSGPLAMSFSAMENYYQIHGREWERYAWIKARAVAGDINSGRDFLASLRPFVYRKYLDYQVYESLEEMKSMINKEIRQQGMQNNIKLGRGGIREIEFIVQSHQLVRGGRDTSLRTGFLKSALHALEQSQTIEKKVSKGLHRAYLFLRTVEHRLQMKDDQQTHQLPTQSDELNILAASMGLTHDEFSNLIKSQREFVQKQFSRLHDRQNEQASESQWQILWNAVVSNQDTSLDHNGIEDFKAVLTAYVQGKSYRSLEARGRKILDQLIPKILQFISKQPNPAQALNRTFPVISSIGGRTAYLSLLDQFPVACKQLVQLCGASPWVSRWIASNPIVLDTLINPRTDLYSFNEDIELLIERKISDDADGELNHDILRQIHHSCILQIAMADLQSQYNATEIRSFISNVAQSIINQVVKLCQKELLPKFGKPGLTHDDEAFGVIAYGKLGSNELSYNADLDLVFIFDDQSLTEETQGGRKAVRTDYYFSRLVQRILTMLTMQTSAGELYDVDTRLRPSGRSGLLVSSLVQYKKYQLEQAWVWEHQALVKARIITRNARLLALFEQIRINVLSQPRDEQQLKSEIVSMRVRMRESSKASGAGYKKDPGGMIDIEFICQYLVLRYAHAQEKICQYRSVMDILNFTKQHDLLDADRAEILIDTYQIIQEIENQHKLNGVIDESKQDKLEKQMEKVKHVWEQIFV